MPIPINPSGTGRKTPTTDASTPAQTLEITLTDLPLFCPREDMALWNHHPRVYLPIDKGSDALCPYCSTRFIFKDSTP